MASNDAEEKRSPYTADRGVPGAFAGETVTRRRLMTGGALAAGGLATALFSLPSLGFALGPVAEDPTPERWQDIGPEEDFNVETYVARVITLVGEIGVVGKTTVYVRKSDPAKDVVVPGQDPQPYVVLSTRCTHLGCPVRYTLASERFICPCHGGVYDSQGMVTGGPPVRPLDRFYTRVKGGRVLVGDRFSVNSKLERYSPRDPSSHLDGLWQYLYPKRPTT